MVKSKIFSFILISIIVFFSCKKNIDTEENINQVYNSLQERQAKAIVVINDTTFYKSESIFKGDIKIENNSIHSELKDQFGSTIVLNFPVNNWAKKPIVSKIWEGEKQPFNCEAMFGKMKDTVQHLGEGYIFTTGALTITSLARSKCVLKFKGKVGRYSSGVNKPKLWKGFSGFIVWKKPNYTLLGIKEKEVFSF